MARLAGEFSALFKIAARDSAVESAISAALGAQKMDVRAKWTSPSVRAGELRKFQLRQTRDAGGDHTAGQLVKRVSDYLCNVGMKIEDLNSATSKAWLLWLPLPALLAADCSCPPGLVSVQSGLLEITGVMRLPPASALSTADVVKGLNGVGVHVNYMDLEVGP